MTYTSRSQLEAGWRDNHLIYYAMPAQMLVNIRCLFTALRLDRFAPYRPESFGLAILPRGLSHVLTFLPKG
jgi:hypothetical protein